MRHPILTISLVAVGLATFYSALYGQDKVKAIDECIEIAVRNNPELRSQGLKIAESKSKHRQEAGNLLPQIDASLSYYRYGRLLPSKKALIGESLNDYYADISLRQVIFSGGKYNVRKNIARISMDAEIYRYEQLKRQVILSVKRAYYDLLKCLLTLEIQSQLLQKLNEQQRIAELLYNSGKISNLDVLKIETQKELSEDMVNNLHNLVYTKSLLLAQSMGQKEPVNISKEIPEIEEDIIINTFCVKNNFEDNPELSYIKSLLEKAEQGIKEAKSELFPTLFLRANYNVEDPSWFSGGANWSNWYIGMGISFPIYHGGITRAQIDQARSRYHQMSESMRLIEISMNTRFESSRATLIDRAARLRTTRKVLELAKETLATAELRYSAGKLSALELIDAQMLWNNAEITYINNVIDYLTAMAEIESICPEAITKRGE